MSSSEANRRQTHSAVPEDIAIIGMACLFPGAPDLITYWQNIMSKVDAISDPPAEAWDADVFYDPDSSANDRVYCKRGGFLGPLADFSPLAFGVMPRAVEGSEPDQWLALRVARAALIDAGYGDELSVRHRTAVILGKGTYLNRGNAIVVQHGRIVDQTVELLRQLHPEYTEADLHTIRQELKQGLPPFNADTAEGLIPNIIAGRIANRLDLMGPSYTVDAACSSSLVAVDIAARGLRNHEYDLALIGGAHVATPVPVLMLFCQLGALSRRERIRPFDKDADGTILGEGIGMAVLKRREDAERDGDRIYAIIKGVGVSSDGRGSSVTAPRLEGEILSLQRAYDQAGVTPRTIGLIEAHGTGTPVGDATEIEALTRVFGVRSGALPWCALGSVKSMVGHLMPAAGMAGLIKAALALHYKVLPPTLNVTDPHPKLEDATSPFYVNSETHPWIHGAHDAPRRAGVNAFGFGGINAHVILEEYTAADRAAPESHPLDWDTEVCILSAASRSDLVRCAQQLGQFLTIRPEVHLRDLAYTLNVPLWEESYRLAIVASSVQDLEQKLSRALERLQESKCRRIQQVQGIYYSEQPLTESGQLAFLFPGEGSQYINMLADLCLHFPEVRAYFDLIDHVFAEHARDYLPSDFIFPRPAFSEAGREAAEKRIWQMEGAVEAVLTASHALFVLLSRLEIHPNALMGHSTGEYSAMLASGMMDLADETLVGEFAMGLNQIFQQATAEGDLPRAALLATAADAETASAIVEQIKGHIYVAIDNCPHQAVIVGEENAVKQAADHLRSRGLLYEPLPFDRPYHTPMFEGFTSRLRPFLERWLVSAPQIRTYSCAAASPFPSDLDGIRELAVEHWVRPVRFRQTIDAMYADGVRIFVEVGPRGNLTTFVNDILRGRPHLAVPADVMNRSGIAQLNHLVGLLAAHGVPMRLDHLYARRSPRHLDLDTRLRPEDKGKRGARIKLATGWPRIEFSEEAVTRLRARTQGSTRDGAPSPGAGSVAVDDQPPIAGSSDRERVAPVHGGDTATGSQPPTILARQSISSRATQVMSAHLEMMERFLAAQQEVMEAFLDGHTVAPTMSRLPALGAEDLPEAGSAAKEKVPLALPQVQVASPSSAVVPDSGVRPNLSAEVKSPDGPDVGQAVPEGAGSLGADTVVDALLRLVSERTGYPVDVLDLDLDLEADLSIDSIKRVEILGSLRQQTGLLEAGNIEQLADCRTLRAVIDVLTAPRNGIALHEVDSPMDTDRERASDRPTVMHPPMPFVRNVVSLIPGEELVALCEVEPNEDLYLRDHALGRQVSTIDPALIGLSVMPFTMSMEMLAEAAAVLVPDQHLIGMRDVHARRWIALDEERLELKIVARRCPTGSGNGVHVQIHEADDMSASTGSTASPIFEGTVIFGTAYPAPPVTGSFQLADERASKWTSAQLYGKVMFHGPAFQGVASMDRIGADGAEATLRVRPSSRLFRSNPAPALITDPVLLDQPGQVVGFWTAEQLATGYVIFPFHLEALHLYGPNPPASARIACRASIQLIGERQVRSDLGIVHEDEKLWACFVGWEDWRFDLPVAFFQFLLSPQNGVLGQEWSSPLASLPDTGAFQAYRLSVDDFPEGFLAAHGGIWRRALAQLVLGRCERELWQELRTPEPRRVEWLLGRVVAKEAVRQHLRQRHDIALCLADIEIMPDEHGRPVPQGSWRDRVNSVPLLSLSHTGGVAVAIAGDGGAGTGIGVDIEDVGQMPAEALQVAFTSDERALLSTRLGADPNSWPLRLWCAKEAAAKALGRGLLGGPQALVVESLDPDTGIVLMGLRSELARMAAPEGSLTLTAFTAREGDLIVATALHDPDGKEPYA